MREEQASLGQQLDVVQEAKQILEVRETARKEVNKVDNEVNRENRQ